MQKVRRAYTRNSWFPFVTDLVLVIGFAIIGRASHASSLDFLGVLGTAWPFVGALLIGWIIVKLTGMHPSKAWPAGVVLFLVTVTSGLALRIIGGDTAATPFVIVTASVLFTFLLVPRLLLHSRNAVPANDD